MNRKQKELLNELVRIYSELAEECAQDEQFHQVMINNNHLFPMSLDEMAYEWRYVVRKTEEELQEQMRLIAENNRNDDIYDLYEEVQKGETSITTLYEVIEREMNIIRNNE